MVLKNQSQLIKNKKREKHQSPHTALAWPDFSTQIIKKTTSPWAKRPVSPAYKIRTSLLPFRLKFRTHEQQGVKKLLPHSIRILSVYLSHLKKKSKNGKKMSFDSSRSSSANSSRKSKRGLNNSNSSNNKNSKQKTLGMGRGANSLSSSRPSFRNSPFSNFGRSPLSLYIYIYISFFFIIIFKFSLII